MRYVLNSAVITTEGLYDYTLIDYVRATEWLLDGEFISTVGYPETAEAMKRLFRIEVPVNRTTIVMAPGDEAEGLWSHCCAAVFSGSSEEEES